MNEIQPSIATSLPSEPPLTLNPRRARFSIVQQLYHTVPGENANGPEPLRFSRWLETDDIAYARTVTVEEEWIPLDLGWLKDNGCSYLFMENASTRPLGKRATSDEDTEWKGKILEYGIFIYDASLMTKVLGMGYLLPEEGMGFSPLAIESLRIRCRKGMGRLTYFVVPS